MYLVICYSGSNCPGGKLIKMSDYLKLFATPLFNLVCNKIWFIIAQLYLLFFKLFGGNYPGGSYPGGNYPGWQLSGWQLSGWQLSWVAIVWVAIIQGAIIRVAIFRVAIIRVAIVLEP